MTVAQRLNIVPGQFTVEHLPHATLPEDDEWIAMVRAPEGLTVVRDASPFSEAERWVGFYGETEHSLDTPGMLAAIVGPLAGRECPSSSPRPTTPIWFSSRSTG